MRKRTLLALLMLFAGSSFNAGAEEAANAPAPKRKANQETAGNPAKLDLSSDEIKKYISTLPGFMTEFKSASLPGSKSGATQISPEKLDSFVRGKGYKDFNEFVAANATILAAYGLLKAQKDRAFLEKEIKALPLEKQKEFEQQLAAFNVQLEMLKKKVSEKTLLSVKENVSALEAVIDKLGKQEQQHAAP
ncbi:MAG: hypothetical protein A2X49_08355 [Lentisphaerae bacterium GWF2_52_8]|nr:MAG: hypothetical protein A2X49_08355 [Lentisphaerae bacterium GWF2_52_8]